MGNSKLLYFPFSLRSGAGLLLLFASGCAFASVNRPPVDLYTKSVSLSQSFPVMPEEAVESSVKALEAMGFEIQAVTPELGLIRTRNKAIPVPQICDCGSWNGGAVAGNGASLMLVNVKAITAATVVSIDYQCATDFTGHNLYGAPTHRESYRCASRGIVEHEFWETLRRIFAAHHPPQG